MYPTLSASLDCTFSIASYVEIICFIILYVFVVDYSFKSPLLDLYCSYTGVSQF